MTHFNFLSNLAAENEVNRALATAKVLQNAGGGTSHTSEQFSRYCVSRSEGAHKAEHFSQKTYSLFAVAADGQPTVNRQSRLMSYRCYLRNLAMIFAVLVLSIANIGMAWGESPYNLDITSAFSSTGNQSKNDGTVTISGYIQSKKYNNVESTKVAYLDGSNYLTVSATSACITSITVTANTDDNSNTHEVAYQTSADGSSWSASTNMGTCANRQSAPTSRTANFSPAVQYVRFTKGGSNKISVGAISITYTAGGGDPDPGDECTKIFWFAKAADAATAGVENNTSTFTGVVSGTSEVSGTITIDGKNYSVTGRGDNGNSAITFTVPVNKTATLYGLASSSGSSARTLTLTGPNEYSQVQSTSASSSTAGTITFTDMTAGNYSIAWGGNGAISMLCLKLCDAEPSCTAPNHVDIKASAEVDGYGRYTIGEDISLTATAYSSAGTGSPITSGITGYQWQKYVGSEWQNVTNEGNISGATTANLLISSCTASNVGSYQCIVSTGATCSTTSYSKMVRVYSLDGNYYRVAWTKNAITWTGNTTGTVTLNLDAKQVYEFKVRDNDGKEYGSGANNYVIQSGDSKDCGTGNVNVRLLTAPAGNYTFTIDITHAQDGNPYVNVVTNYPTVSHPNTGYVYVQKFNWTPRLHYWYNDANKLTDWENDPTINADQYVNICGTDYWYVPVINYYCNFIASDHGSNSTGDQHTNDLHPGQRLYNDGSWKWGEFTTYSISFNAGGGTGTMDAIEGICPSGSQVLTSNSFTKPSGCASFAHWIADVAVTANGSAVTAGNPIADGATLSGISGDIALTAVWKLAAPTITDNGDNTFSISGSIGGASYYYTTDGNTPTTSSSLYSSAVDFSAGEADITAKAIAHKDGYVDSDVASQACTYHAPAEGCIDANLTNFGAGNSSGDASKTLADGTVVAMNECTNSASSVSIGGDILFTAPTGKAFETFSFVATCGSDDKQNYYIINEGSKQSLENSTKASKRYTITIPASPNTTTIQIIKNGTTPAVTEFCYTYKDICTVVAAPTALTCSAQTSSSLTFTWTKAANASGYTASLYNNSGCTGDPVASENLGDVATVTFSELSASTTYYCKVHSHGDGSTYCADGGTTDAQSGTTSAAPDVTAPTFVSSVPANGATDVATSGTIVLTFNEPLGSVDPSKFTLTGATKGTVTIDGSDAAKVNITYTGAENSSTVTLATDAAAVSDLAGNALAAALSDISFTTAAAAPAGDCITIAYFETTSHSNSSSKPDNAGKYIYGYTNSAKTEAYAYTITSSTGDNKGQGTGESDYLRMNYGTTVTIYADNTTTGGTPASFSNVTSVSVDFKMKNSSYYTTFDIYVGGTKIANNVSLEGAAQSAFTTFTYDNLEQLSGTVRIVNKGSGSSNYHFYVDNIQICTSSLPACTTPELPTLSNKTVCEGGDADVAWDATVDNASYISTAGETVTYSWKKKGNDTELANTATFDLGSSATEAMAGTYVVTVTVSKAGYASSMATKEVTLTVNEATEVTAITADKATVYPTNSVTLTATANVTPQSWQWYTCTSAEGAGEAIINDATSASYTIASAPDAGTHYYKVKATGDCGTAERVYTLTVTAASECETYYFFANAADATTNKVTQNEESFFSGAKEGTNDNNTIITVDGKPLTISKRTSASDYSVVFIVPTGATASLYTNAKAKSSTNKLTITRSSDSEPMVVTDQTTLANYTLSDIPEGTWTLTCGSGNNWYYGAIIVKVCSGEACNDPEVTASVNNSTACVGSSVTFTATGAHAEATYQWQKYSGGAWTNIAEATDATYNIHPVATTDALKYRVIAHHECARTSNEVTLSVPVAPVFNSFTATRTVMATQELSITDVEASDATSYAWYKSADDTYNAGTDTRVGRAKELVLASGGEAADATYYLFCVASNDCGSTTSGAITVNVTALVEEECATRGNESDAEFVFTNTGMSSGTYDNKNVWYKNSNSNYLTYSAPEGKYLATAKVTIASSNSSNASYQYSINNETSWSSGVTISGLTTSLTEKTINLPANVTDFRIGRNLDGAGENSGTFYLHKACFIYAESCTATTVTPSESSVNYEMGGAWTNPTFTVKHEETTFDPQPTLTYSSSNEDIASVDESGNVTFNDKAGTVTITASYAGNATYCASEGSYTITVSCSGGAPKIVAADGTNMSGCNSSITLNAKQQDGKTDFTGGSYKWFRNGVEIEGATSSSYTAIQTGVYTVEYTSEGCTSPSTNHATVTSDKVEPEVERLVPFQYYHVDKTYSDQMKDRHLFSVKGSAAYGSTGKNFKLTMSRNSGEAVDITTAASIFVTKSGDGQIDTVMIDLNKLSTKYNAGDKLVLTCAAVDCSGNVSAVYKDEITIHVIDATPTLALICSGSSKAGGTRNTEELTVGGDFLTGYNVADLCQQTGNKTFDANTEWGLYTDLKAKYIVTPVNGYAVFNKLNYEPFDILLLTDYPKASKSDAAATVLDDMADLCDYRPMLSFKTHMVAKSPSKWAAKGFTTSPVVSKTDGCLNLNIVCYAHPMFASLKTGKDVYSDVGNTSAPLVYTMLTDVGYEGSKGMQGFELAAAENFITIGLTHYNASIAKSQGKVTWTPNDGDRMLVTVAERQANPEARFILFSLNCGAQSKLTEKGEDVVLASLNYLLGTAEGTIEPADCSFTFDNGDNAPHDKAWYKDPDNCPECTGELGDGLWSTAANWGPDYRLLPGEFTSVRIKKPVEVDITDAHVMEARILEDGSITIPAGKALQVKSTIRRMDGTEIYPTEISDIHIGSDVGGNGTLIFDNNSGDTKARVDMYSTAKADMKNMTAEASTWQYIGTPHTDVTNARSNYYGSWLYQYSGSGWDVIPNGGPLVPFRGYCITHPISPNVYEMTGTLAATTTQDIAIPAGFTVIANSWVAPIDINAITDDDMEGISVKTIYFFNTGTDAEGDNETGTEAGTYRAAPIHSASYTGDWQIPSMQGFYISTETAGTLHLDYDRHVRPTGGRTIVSNPMYAPRRAKAAEEEPAVLKIFARGSRYQDKLVVLEREDFTRGYDSGWDGEAWGGGTLSPMVYVTGEGREDAVSAIPEFEGTVVAFKAGEDSEYRFEFIYSEDAEPLYLFDTENNTYTQIMTGNAYYFTTSDKAPHSRFILTRKAPQITTGTELTSDGESAKARKLLIEDKMYILLNGMLYDATGKVVK